MAKRRRGKVQGPSVGGGFVGNKPGTAGVPGGLAPITAQNPYVGPQNPYTATAPPIDPNYEATKISAGRNVALSDADALYQNTQIENSYGLGSDTSNPYSRAKLLENNYQRQQRGTQIGLAQQGQLYSGAMQTAQDENTRNYSMGYDQLARGYGDAKYQNTRAQLGTYAANATGVDQEKFNALLRALGGT